MAQALLLLVCILIGIGARRHPLLPLHAHQSLNFFIVRAALPAMAFLSLRSLAWQPSLLGAVAMPWLMFLLAAALFVPLGRRLGWSSPLIGSTVMMAGFANTSFVGIPVLAALEGPHTASLAILIDQAGSYLTLSALGIAFAARFGSHASTPIRSIVIKAVRYPPFLGMVAGLASRFFEVPEPVLGALRPLSSLVVPLALISVGLQLRFSGARDLMAPLSLSLLYKLLLAPALTLLVFWLLAHPLSSTERSIVLEAAMGPSIAAGIIASQEGLEERLIPLALGFGIPLCLLSAFLWSALMRFL